MRPSLVTITVAALAASGCNVKLTAEPRGQALGAAPTYQLAWGSGPAEAGLRRAITEHPAMGPSAIAVAPDGTPLVLDRLNQRVLRLAEGGRPPQVIAQAPEDAEDLAISPDGVLALYSPLRARVWVYGDDAPAELSVPRLIREVRGVTLGRSRQILVDTAYQETYSLGSPSVPQSEAAIFGQRREGAALLADGRGVAVHLLADGRPELLLRRPGERLAAAARIPLPEQVLAARVVGVAGRAVCLRLEQAQATSGPAFNVSRRVVCHDVDSGARLLARDLPAPGLYLPSRELAVGGTPARVAFLHATPAGLRIETMALPARPEEVTP